MSPYCFPDLGVNWLIVSIQITQPHIWTTKIQLRLDQIVQTLQEWVHFFTVSIDVNIS